MNMFYVAFQNHKLQASHSDPDPESQHTGGGQEDQKFKAQPRPHETAYSSRGFDTWLLWAPELLGTHPHSETLENKTS